MASLPNRRALRVLAGGALLAGACAVAPISVREARAQTSLADGNGEGMNTRLFHAAVDSKGFFTVNGTDVLGKATSPSASCSTAASGSCASASRPRAASRARKTS